MKLLASPSTTPITSTMAAGRPDSSPMMGVRAATVALTRNRRGSLPIKFLSSEHDHEGSSKWSFCFFEQTGDATKVKFLHPPARLGSCVAVDRQALARSFSCFPVMYRVLALAKQPRALPMSVNLSILHGNLLLHGHLLHLRSL